MKEHLKTEYHYLGLSLDGLSATGRGMKETDRTKILIPHYDQLFHFSNKLFTQLKYDQDCTLIRIFKLLKAPLLSLETTNFRRSKAKKH